MNQSFASPQRLLFGGLTLAAALILFAQWKTLSALRLENRQRLEAKQERPRAALENQPGQELGSGNEEIQRLRRENKDLHKLRNEVAQLRKQKPEIERARAENARLRQARQTREQFAHLAELPGYVPKETWANAGFNSPEATVQTFFWAAREGKFDRVLESLTPAARQTIGIEFQSPASEQRTEMINTFNQFKGYRIAEKNTVSADEMTLSMQAPLFGDKTLRWPLKRFGNEWKISGEPRE